MNASPSHEGAPASASRAEIHSALFASMVIQQTNLALMFLGKMPHPESGQTLQDIDSAKLVIDQLEMLELKTRGNLDPQEEKLLKQSLTSLRMAFVEAVDRPACESPPAAAGPGLAPRKSSGSPAPEDSPGQSTAGSSEDESRKKCSKKY